MVAEVIINRTAKKLNRIFDYNIPENMEDFDINGRKLYVWNGADSWNEPEISYSVILEKVDYGYSLAYNYAFTENIIEDESK